MADGEALRLAHFSDIHISARPLGWRARDFLTKRVTGWMNQRIGRGRRFRAAAHIAAAMMTDIRQRGCRHAIFSGDATVMGFASEIEAAARVLDFTMPGLAVPGNHDYYTRSAVRSGVFEKSFVAWQNGERIGGHVYPFAQRVGHCWLIGVNTARSNFLLWDSRGQMGAEQGERLRELLGRLGPGPRILVTHYPAYLEDGGPEQRWRRLRDMEALRAIAVEGNICLWLHGHRHSGYLLEPQSTGLPFAIICAGSATQEGRWAWNEYLIEGMSLTMCRRNWDPANDRFSDSNRRELSLRGA